MVNKKETVLHLLNSSSFSGAENVVCQIIENTDKSTKTIYCSPDGSIRKTLKERGIFFSPLSKLSYSALKSAIKKHKPSVIHAHDFRASLLASLFYKQVRIISHIHQNPEWLHGNGIKSKLYKLTAPRYDKIVVVADAIKESPVFDDVEDEGIITLRNFVNEAAIIERAKHDEVEASDIVFCGRLEPVKQPLDFIKAVDLITEKKPDVKAIMLGDGVLRDDCKALIESLGLQKNIKLEGFQQNPFSYMHKSRFLMLTSQFEGFGLVALESIILNSIVLSYDIAAVREMTKGDEEFVTTPDEMANVFLQLDGSKSKYSALQKRQREAVSDLIIKPQIWRQSIRQLYQFEDVR